jgi:hypothetical protein
MHIPDYFLVLMKQFSNSANESEAENLTQAISEALYMNLGSDARLKIFEAMPVYLQPKKHLFGRRLTDKGSGFDVIRFARFAIISAGLTDDNELRNGLKAYFKSLKIISSRKQSQQIADNLPASLAKLYAEC